MEHILAYEPTNTDITLKGDDVVEVCTHSPVYLIVDGKVRVLECAVYHNAQTYLIAGKELE